MDVTTTVSLTSLPLHLLDTISEFVTALEPSRRSLFAFSLTSKVCHAATTRQRYARITFFMRGEDELGNDVTRWANVLKDGCLGYVRAVKVDLEPPSYKPSIPGWIPEEQEEDQEEDQEDAAVESDDEFDFCEPRRLQHRQVRVTPKTRQKNYYEPLARFLDCLPALQDLVWVMPYQLPPCLLSAIHKRHSRIRLHINSFSLPSIARSSTDLYGIDQYDTAIATSPCLYSVGVECSILNRGLDCTKEAIYDMIKESAPELKSVRLFFGWTYIASVQHKQSPPQCRLQQGGDSKGCLEHLKIGVASPWQLSDIQAWASRTRFECLRSLEFASQLDLSGLREMTGMAQRGDFRSLQRLKMRQFPPIEDEREWQEADAASALLFEALPPLVEISLFYNLDIKTFTAILCRHGNSIRKLELLPKDTKRFVISHDRVDAITKQCPNLLKLKLVVPRTEGNEQEVALYRSLGQLQALRRVTLHLDYSHTESPGAKPANGDFGQTRINKRLRSMLINTAIDSTLATAILRLLRSNNPNLEYLKLATGGSGYWKEYNMERIEERMTRSWICRLDRGRVTVKKIKKHQRYAAESSPIISKENKSTWESIWPGTSDRWWEQWSSLPLALGDQAE
ncbi:hypothetical protein F4778DRAFT_713319 [Xylariomycetidae sp. FL2044]|nr:hypothetical protein F4778DRAFT_713319 [Xylariomycetidae sp. FL2044]